MPVDTPVDIKKSNALVIGNGKSRLNFDLNQLQEHFTTYGCNALYRDFIPDYLVSVDRFMVYEIIESKVHHKCKFYTQTDSTFTRFKGEPINYVIQDRRLADSGSAAMRLAGINKHKIVYMIGFDYKMRNDYVDNVYANTKNYASGPLTNGGTYMTQQWESRVRANCKEFKETQFIRVDGVDYKPVVNYPNFTNISIEQFKEIINEL